MSKDKPLVSVLIMTCDRPDYLDRCLFSVLYQDFKNYEILIMDDNSDAQTEAVVKKYEPLFNIGANYRHIRNEPHLGLQKSLNRGLREARGDYIARLDDDDAWADVDKLSRQIEFLDTHPEYVLVGTGVIVVDENGTELRRSFLPERSSSIISSSIMTSATPRFSRRLISPLLFIPVSCPERLILPFLVLRPRLSVSSAHLRCQIFSHHEVVP